MTLTLSRKVFLFRVFLSALLITNIALPQSFTTSVYALRSTTAVESGLEEDLSKALKPIEFDFTQPVAIGPELSSQPLEFGGKGSQLGTVMELLPELQKAMPTGFPLDVPSGFVIPVGMARTYDMEKNGFQPTQKKSIFRALRDLEGKTNRGFGNPQKPLILAVRSSPVFSMPGILLTVLNIGLNDQTWPSIGREYGSELFGLVQYLRLIHDFGVSVYGLNPESFSSAMRDAHIPELDVRRLSDSDRGRLRGLIKSFKKIYSAAGKRFPQNANRQLRESIGAVLSSWNQPPAKAYRASEAADSEMNLAVIVQQMVFGDADARSGSAVFVTGNPDTGEEATYGYALSQSPASLLVTGQAAQPYQAIHKPKTGTDSPLVQLLRSKPVSRWRGILSRHRGDPFQEFEAVFQGNKLYLVQMRPARLSVHAQVAMIKGGTVARFDPTRIPSVVGSDRVRYKLTDSPKDSDILGTGEPSIPAVVMGGVEVFKKDDPQMSARIGDGTVLYAEERSDALLELLIKRQKDIVALVTTFGDPLSHEAVIARGLGIVSVTGVQWKSGPPYLGTVLVDGNTGQILSRKVDLEYIREGDATPLFEAGYDLNKIRARAYKAVIDPAQLRRSSESFRRQDWRYLSRQVSYDRLLMRFAELSSEIKAVVDSGDESKYHQLVELSFEKHYLHQLIFQKGREFGRSDDLIQVGIDEVLSENVGPVFWEKYANKSRLYVPGEVYVFSAFLPLSGRDGHGFEGFNPKEISKIREVMQSEEYQEALRRADRFVEFLRANGVPAYRHQSQGLDYRGYAPGYGTGLHNAGIQAIVEVRIPREYQDRVISYFEGPEAEGTLKKVFEQEHGRLHERGRYRWTSDDADVPPSFRSESGLEELQVQQAMRILNEAAPQGTGVLVIEAGAFVGRGGLEEFVARMGRALNKRFILFGSDSAAVKELALRNGITVVDSDDLADLVSLLAAMDERSNRIGYLGDPQNANLLSGILPAGMTVTALNPQTVLRDILLFLGYAASVLDSINASGLEEQLARSTAA